MKTNPRLLEIGVKSINNVLLVAVEPSDLLLSWKSEDSPTKKKLTTISLKFEKASRER